jgi:hypothetical protein
MRLRFLGQTLISARLMSRLQRLAFVLFVVCVFSSCGLETYSILDPPIIAQYTAGTDEPLSRYFHFRTSGGVSGDVAFQGTSVFYKIYASESVLISEANSISDVNAQYSANGYNRIASLGYQELNSTARNDPLIPGTTGATVVIRLFNEGSFTTRVHENDTDVSPIWGIPLRRANSKGFNFFAATESGREDNPVPVSGDPDVNFSGFSDGNTWYVNAYAVSIGRDTSFANLHSQLLHLGYIRIRG